MLVLVAAGVVFSGLLSPKPLPALTNAPATASPATAFPAAKIPVGEKVLGLRWMPLETDFVIHVKLAEVFKAPLLKGPLSDPSVTSGIKDFQKQVGLVPSEIESVTIGVVGFGDLMTKRMAAGAAKSNCEIGIVLCEESLLPVYSWG